MSQPFKGHRFDAPLPEEESTEVSAAVESMADDVLIDTHEPELPDIWAVDPLPANTVDNPTFASFKELENIITPPVGSGFSSPGMANRDLARRQLSKKRRKL